MARFRPLLSQPLAALLLAAALHMLVFDRGLGGDGWATFAALESLADDGDLWLEDDHRGVMNGLVGGAGGHLVMQYPPGILLLDAVPFFAGRALDRLLPAGVLGDGADLPPAGRVPRRVFLSAAAIVAARNAAVLLGLLWTVLALRRIGLPDRRAVAAAALAFFGGPLIFYALVGMTHAPTFALAALLWLLLVRQRENQSAWVALAAGAVLGGAVLVRFGAVALFPAAVLALAGGLRAWTSFGAGFSLPLLALPFWWQASFGRWLAPPYGGDWQLSLLSPWNVLLSPVHGLFLFHPALLFAAVGLLLAVRRERRVTGWGAISLVWFLGVAVLHGGWSEWANTGGYGQRFLIDALPVLALGFAAWRAEIARPAWAWGPPVAAALFGYGLFFAAVAGLVEPPAPYPWPQRLGEYAVLLEEPPGAAGFRRGLGRASFLLRALAGGSL